MPLIPKAVVAIGGALLLATPVLARAPEVLRAVAALPVEIAGRFEQPFALQPAPGGAYYVFDRRAHTVYRVDAARTVVEPLVTIGAESGRVLRPSAFSSARDGSFAISDAPLEKERVQVFNAQGQRIAGFELPSRSLPRVTFDNVVLNGIGSLYYTGRRILISQPEHGGLITEYDVYGQSVRTIGRLRPTGQEGDSELHVALNAAIPLATRDGGFFVVFQTGVPELQRYGADGALQFARRIEGRELDRHVAALPTVWPRRRIGEHEIPIVAPTVRAAALDGNGHLWVSFVVPYVYEYDEDGDKVRAVQLEAAGAIAPTSLAFTPSGRLLVTPGLYEFDPRK